ncbi:hypothetical protein H3S80_05870 [Bartonella sp. M0177]|uniref:hypothetical protein n=1 Tax=Bartonella sp. M0177 TaxID=2750940 RepID=UPI0018DCB5AA|nr:hypothetical protein [Bartonella sp. M0177]MBI0003580.1 hypothetical protein [Bartonella sp. M0177]
MEILQLKLIAKKNRSFFIVTSALIAKNERVFTRRGHNFSCVNSLATLKQLDKNGKLAHIIVRQNSQRLYRAGSEIDEAF